MQQLTLSCYTCGQGLELDEERPPCEELDGWITIFFWKGKGRVEHVNFCSMGCFHHSLLNRITPIPEIFYRSFDEDD